MQSPLDVYDTISKKHKNEICGLRTNMRIGLEELKSGHEAEVKGLHLFYQTTLNNLQLNHDVAVRTIPMNHEI